MSAVQPGCYFRCGRKAAVGRLFCSARCAAEWAEEMAMEALVTPEQSLMVIHTARELIRATTHEMRMQQRHLAELVADAFSKESEPINGITAEPSEITIGYRPCEKSPIPVCAYSESGGSLPSQKKEPGFTGRVDECLFCGTLQGECESDGHQLFQVKR
jgi:hypothetical protein